MWAFGQTIFKVIIVLDIGKTGLNVFEEMPTRVLYRQIIQYIEGRLKRDQKYD